jgi:hypothetical protein
MSRGGEPLEQVMGRAEEEELPKYESGALQVEGPAAGSAAPLVDAGFLNTYVPTGGVGTHTMRALIESARVVPPGQLHCSQVLFALISSCFVVAEKWIVYHAWKSNAPGYSVFDLMKVYSTRGM